MLGFIFGNSKISDLAAKCSETSHSPLPDVLVWVRQFGNKVGNNRSISNLAEQLYKLPTSIYVRCSAHLCQETWNYSRSAGPLTVISVLKGHCIKTLDFIDPYI